jgi:hypothetical protein
MTARKTRQPVNGPTSAPQDSLMDSYVAAKRFIFGGRQFLPGEPITLAVYQHNRFETLVRAGLVKAV